SYGPRRSRGPGPDLCRKPALELRDLRRVEIAERGPHVRTKGHTLTARHPLERGVAWERLHPLTQGREPGGALFGRIADDRRDLLGECGREPRPRPDRPGLAAPMDQRLGADEDVEPVEQVAGERIPRGVRD